VLFTEGGFAAECAIWGLFWWEEGRVCAPSLDLGVLPGVARARISELTGGVVGRRVRREDLAGRSLFVANAARGVVPVARFEGRPVAQDEGTSRLSASFWS
jgi:branched-subunit amino acid aminotransferase/4-amino-4-deoxychorismate lyase